MIKEFLDTVRYHHNKNVVGSKVVRGNKRK